MIVDANVVLRAFFPDEAQSIAQMIVREHVGRQISLRAPELMPYELGNAVWQAERRGRIKHDQADQIMQAMAGLEIELLPLDWGEMLPPARRFNCSAYDAAYLTLAERLGEPFVTGDEKLYRAVHEQMEGVVWIENYTNASA